MHIDRILNGSETSCSENLVDQFLEHLTALAKLGRCCRIFGEISMRLGEVLINQGYATPAQVDAALSMQRQRGGHLGTLLVAMGVITPDVLFAAVQSQREKAVVDCENMLECSRAQHGPAHQNTSLAHYDLARALFEAGRTADAVPHAKAAFDGFVASEGHYDDRSRNAARLVSEAREIAKSKRKPEAAPSSHSAPQYRVH
jgi:hypothetical protein